MPIGAGEAPIGTNTLMEACKMERLAGLPKKRKNTKKEVLRILS